MQVCGHMALGRKEELANRNQKRVHIKALIVIRTSHWRFSYLFQTFYGKIKIKNVRKKACREVTILPPQQQGR